jgi:hypothetical protein
MDMKRLAVGTIVGAVILHVTGYLIFDVAAAEYYAANQGPASASDAFRDLPMQLPLVVANLCYGALITLGLLSRESAPTLARGAIVGAVIGFLVWLHADLVFYSYYTIRPLPVVIVDPLLEIVHAGIAGAVIAGVLARVPAGATIRPAE